MVFISVKAGASTAVWEQEQQDQIQQSRKNQASGAWLLNRGFGERWAESVRLTAQGEELRETLQRDGMIHDGRNWILVLQPYGSDLGCTAGLEPKWQGAVCYRRSNGDRARLPPHTLQCHAAAREPRTHSSSGRHNIQHNKSSYYLELLALSSIVLLWKTCYVNMASFCVYWSVR